MQELLSVAIRLLALISLATKLKLNLNHPFLEARFIAIITLPMFTKLMRGLISGDLLMGVLYRVRPYELVLGSANRLYDEWVKIGSMAWAARFSPRNFHVYWYTLSIFYNIIILLYSENYKD